MFVSQSRSAGHTITLDQIDQDIHNTIQTQMSSPYEPRIHSISNEQRWSHVQARGAYRPAHQTFNQYNPYFIGATGPNNTNLGRRQRQLWTRTPSPIIEAQAIPDDNFVLRTPSPVLEVQADEIDDELNRLLGR